MLALFVYFVSQCLHSAIPTFDRFHLEILKKNFFFPTYISQDNQFPISSFDVYEFCSPEFQQRLLPAGKEVEDAKLVCKQYNQSTCMYHNILIYRKPVHHYFRQCCYLISILSFAISSWILTIIFMNTAILMCASNWLELGRQGFI